MHMRAGAATGGTEAADRRALFDALARADKDRGEMAIAGVKSVAVINFYQIAVARMWAREHDRTRRRRRNGRAPRPREIDAGMKRNVSGKGIHAGTESACDLKLAAMDRCRKRHVPKREIGRAHV